MPPAEETYPVELDPFFAEDLRQMERAVNYRRWQLRMVAPFLGGSVLEVGGGIGNFTTALAACGCRVTTLEPNGFCYRQLVDKTSGLANIRTLRVAVEDLDGELAPDERFDSVVLMNVLEHLADDRAVLAALAARLAPGGRMVVLVPACPWAFGPTDERLGHYRRYDKGRTRRVFGEAGLRVGFLRYYNFAGIWGWWWNARFGKRQGQNDAQIRFFDKWVVPVVSRVECFLRPPVGQSILAVGTVMKS